MTRKLHICFSILLLLSINIQSQDISYSFIAAGHAYGSHDGNNIALHPPLIEALYVYDESVEFIVFTGDIVNHSNEESWQRFEEQMEYYPISYYCAMGNHDNNSVAHDFYNQKFGNDYYAFTNLDDRFVVLNSTEQDRAISPNQIEFLKNQLDSSASGSNVFVFFHEVIWNSHEKYKDTRSNSRSRYDKVKDLSNYWTEVHSLLEQYSDRNIVLISGDVAGNPDAIPAFYDNYGHITLISSGMGEVEDENYLQVDVMKDGSVQYKLVALREENEPKPLEWYSIPEITGAIEGETNISDYNQVYSYHVSEIDNADSYVWDLPGFASGSSSGNLINIEFEQDFANGELKVKAVHDGFGSSEPVSLNISSTVSSSSNEHIQDIVIYFAANQLFINGYNSDVKCIEIISSDGKLIKTSNVQCLAENIHCIDLNVQTNGIYLVRLLLNNQEIVKKVWISATF